VREPRILLAEMGCDVPADVEIRVWDSSAEVRYLVLPERPPGTENLSEEELAGLVTRDSMIGVARLT
jgi:nitrile hydratase subunit alpha